MSPTTAAAPHVRGHPPGDLGHGMQFVVVCLEVEAVHCVAYGKSGVYVHLHPIVNVYVWYVTL